MRSSLASATAVVALLAAACGSSSSSDAPDNMSVTPSTGYSSVAVPVVIAGTGFLAKVTGGSEPTVDTHHRAWLGTREIPVTWENTSTLDGTVPGDLAPGTYDLTVENALGNRGELKGAYTVLSAPILASSASVDHPTVTVGQTLTLSFTVKNNGSGTITSFALATPTPSSSNGGYLTSTGERPSAPSTLAAGETRTFTWQYLPSAPPNGSADVSIIVSATGVDSASGTTLTATPAAPVAVSIRQPAVLTVTPPTGGTITCGAAACGTSFYVGTQVTLIATPTAGYAFTAWTGDCAGQTTSTCTLTMDGNKTVGATFTAGAQTLTLAVNPAGTANAAGFTCAVSGGAAGACAATYPTGTALTVTAPAPNAGYRFSNWSGACSGAGACAFTMPASGATVTANFGAATATLSVSANPTAGTTGITCSVNGGAAGACAASYPIGTSLSIAAPAAGGYTFNGWSGGTCSGAGACTFTMPASGATVTANFVVATATLSVSANPTTGTTGITCSVNGGAAATCATSYPIGTSLTIAAPAAGGYAFTGWSGGTCSGAGACSFSMPGTGATVTANYTLLGVIPP